MFLIFVIFFLLINPNFTRAQSSADELQAKIVEYTAKITQLQKAQDTLENQLAYLNSQTQLTQLKITQTEVTIDILKKDISKLSNDIDNLDSSLNQLSSAYLTQISQLYKLGKTNNLLTMVLKRNFNDFYRDYRYLSDIQTNHKSLLVNMETTRTNFDNQKQEKQEKQTQLQKLQTELDREKQSLASQTKAKNNLLADTKNSEQTYQQKLSEAKAQLASFRRFITSQGGASILKNQTKCDDWGCYYNQRDSQWGNMGIGLSPDSMAEYGCLITSSAMIATHYGKNIKPSDIAGNSSNFFGRTAYMQQGSITANGASITRTRVAATLANITSEVSAGRPVIVGVRISGGEHFVVIKKKEGDQFIMNDPFVESGKDIVFTTKYSLSSIYKVDYIKVN